MMPQLLFGLLLAANMASAQSPTVYKHTTPDGRTIYSDQPSPDATAVALPSPNISDAPPSPPPSTAQDQPAPAFKGYSALKITQPQADQSFDDNTGNVQVAVQIQPDLQPGHKLRIMLDGKAQGKASGQTSLSLSNLDRGEHQISAEVLDKAGKVLKRSAPVRFNVFRTSVSMPGARLNSMRERAWQEHLKHPDKPIKWSEELLYPPKPTKPGDLTKPAPPPKNAP